MRMLAFVEKHVLVATISYEGCCGYSEPRKAALESIPPGEGAGIPPLLTMSRERVNKICVPYRDRQLSACYPTSTYALAQGSFAVDLAAEVNLLTSNPVGFSRDLAMLNCRWAIVNSNVV